MTILYHKILPNKDTIKEKDKINLLQKNENMRQIAKMKENLDRDDRYMMSIILMKMKKEKKNPDRFHEKQ